MDTMMLNCWIRGQYTFQVKISTTQVVEDLARAIKKKNSVTFRELDAHALKLYKPKLPLTEPYEENLRTFILSVDGQLLKMGPKKLSEIFPETPPEDDIHVIVDAPSTIQCWFRGSALNARLEISIRPDATTTQLKGSIKRSHPSIKNVNEDDIRLYKISGGEDGLEESLNKTGSGVPLQLVTVLANFTGLPVLDPLRVIVEDVSDSSKGNKRKGEEDDDTARERSYLRGAHLATTQPSHLAQSKEFREWRQSSKRAEIVDHRCLQKQGVIINDYPDISLQYEGFGHFIDIFDGAQDVPGIERVPATRLGPAVDDFADEMSLMYTDEQTRLESGIAALNEVFSARSDGHFFEIRTTPARNNSRSDGCYLGPHDVTTCVVEFKNEAAGSTIPYAEMAGYFAHSTRENADAGNTLLGRWNYPCLGLTIIGMLHIVLAFRVQLTVLPAHDIKFYGMIYNGPNRGWRVDPLTPGLSCIPGKDRIALHNAFTAASVLLARINQDARRLLDNPPPVMRGNRILPAISRLRRPDSPSSITFKIISELFPTESPDRFLYKAKPTEGGEGKDIVVMFTRSYSRDLHEFCAGRGQAPKLLGFQRLPGGFFGIAMEHVNAIPDSEIERGWEEQLQDLVESFHAKDLVHGDLREPNIIIAEGSKVMVIDFDWAGKEGVASYPRGNRLTGQLLLDRNRDDLKITKDDDLRVMCKTLRMAGLDCRYCT